jgi:beta-glucanase (GH16 family)
MKKLLVFFMSLLLSFHIVFAQTPSNDPHWKLDWEDHFNTLNTNIWEKAPYCDHGGKSYLLIEENVWVANGNLVIEVNNKTASCPTSYPDPPCWSCGRCVEGKTYNYTGGWLGTKKPYQPHYGYIEARLKLPYRKENNKIYGFAHGFWTFIGDGITNPSSPAEIDIIEIFGGSTKNPNTFKTSVHKCYKDNENNYPLSYPTCEDYNYIEYNSSSFDYRDWHNYAIEWNADRIIFFFFFKAFRTINNHKMLDPVRLIFSLTVQVGYEPPKSPSFQEYMLVDYVKVYSLKCDKNKTSVNEIANFNTYVYDVKKSITMSNATTIPANSKITLRATDFIELKLGFEVQTGRELYLDVTPCVSTAQLKPPDQRD